MSSYASTADWTTGASHRRRGRWPGRGWEIAGIVLGFIFVWPFALAYLVWKLAGYPLPQQARAFLQRHFEWSPQTTSQTWHASTGNSAFEEYRRRELERLEEERRRLDEESRAFAEFVEELKRARDREEFDAFMARRRGNSASSDTV